MPENGQEEAVYILLVTCGRRQGDGLPDGSDGAALMCYAAARDEKRAVDETVAVLKQAGLAPLEVESYGTDADPDIDLGDGERALMDRARSENAVIVASTETL